jgi:hypothetical protein
VVVGGGIIIALYKFVSISVIYMKHLHKHTALVIHIT